MRQYTTPLQTLFVKGVEITDTDRVFVTYSGRKSGFPVGLNSKWDYTFTIDDPVVTLDKDGKGTWIEVNLTQEQTGAFDSCETVGVEVNWITESGRRNATNIRYLKMEENLLKEVIE